MSTIFLRGEDAAMIAETARRWIDAEYSATEGGHAPETWAAMAGLGWPCLALPEEHGGLGLPADAALALAGECGRGLVTEPVVAASLVASTLVGAALQADASDGLAEGMAGGDRIAVVMGLDTPFPLDAEGDLAGVARHVPGAAHATDLLVVARRPAGALALIALPDGVERRDYLAVDGRALSDVVLDGVCGTALAEGPMVAVAVARALALQRAALAAEAVGAMERAIEITGAYLQERRQFGQPLARFQALRHRIADMHADAEMARTMAAMLLAPDGTPADAALADRALALITTTARTLGERAIQLHGGMGMTREMAIGGYFKRLLYLSTALGGEMAPRSRIASALAGDAGMGAVATEQERTTS